MSAIYLQPVDCKCGRRPETKMCFDGHGMSLSCKCGTKEVQFLATSWINDHLDLSMTWNSIIEDGDYHLFVEDLNW